MSFPRHEILGGEGVSIPYSGHLLYDLCTYREKNDHLVGRVSAEVGLALITLTSMVETVVRIPFLLGALLFSSRTKNWFQGYKLCVLTIFYSLYGVCINLFVQNLTRQIIDLDTALDAHGEIYSLFTACQAGDRETAQALIQKGKDPHAKFHESISPAIAAKLYGHVEFGEICPLNKWEKEYLNLKRLSHWLSLDGSISFHEEEIPLEGAICSRWLFGAFSKAIKEFGESGAYRSSCFLHKDHLNLLQEALESAEKEHSYPAIAKEIREGNLAFVDAGWKNHSICLCFLGDYFAVGNRGDHAEKFSTLSTFKIDPKQITPEIVEEIATHQLLSDALGINYFYHTLPAKLSPTGSPVKDDFCRAIEEIAPKPAQAGNCSLSGKKSALRFAWVSLLTHPPHAEFLTREQAVERGRLESKLFTNWAAAKCYAEIEPIQNFPQMEMPTMRLAIARAAQKQRRFEYLRGKLNLHPFRSLLDSVVMRSGLKESFL